MIFVNLLPDIKLEYARALRIKRLLVLLSAVLITCCIIIVSVLFFTTEVQQPREIAKIEGTGEGANIKPADSNKAIIAEIQANDSIQDILTIQNQLDRLPELRADRIAVNRLFSDGTAGDLAYLDNLVSGSSRLISASFNFETNTFSIAFETDDDKTAVNLYNSVRFIGFDGCRPNNKLSRIYPFRVPTPIVIGSDSSQGEDDEEEKYSSNIAGTFSAALFNPEFPEDKLKLIVPNANVGIRDLFQPDNECQLPSDGERLDPVSQEEPPAPQTEAQSG